MYHMSCRHGIPPTTECGYSDSLQMRIKVHSLAETEALVGPAKQEVLRNYLAGMVSTLTSIGYGDV